MDQVDLFKEYFNLFLLENSEEMLKKALKVVDFDENNYLLMQAYLLCEYDKDQIYYIKDNMVDRITRYFNEVMKYSYSIRRSDRSFTNEYILNLSEKFDFIRNLPLDHISRFSPYQKNLFNEYWENISIEKQEKYNLLFKNSNNNRKSKMYSDLLIFFLGNEFSYYKERKDESLITIKIDKDTLFFIEINNKLIDIELDKYNRFPTIYIRCGMVIDSYKFYFNQIEHPAICSIILIHDYVMYELYYGNMEEAFKWIFIHCDVTSYYIKMCFDFYKESLFKYIERYS